MTTNNCESNEPTMKLEDVMHVEPMVLTETQFAAIQALKENGNEFVYAMSVLGLSYPRGAREFAIAKTKMEEVVMWATKGICKR